MTELLIMSGYFANVEKKINTFINSILRIFIPYVIFEAAYLLMLFFIGKSMQASTSIDNLTFFSFIDLIAENPKGPYWYLHTLVICTSVYYFVYSILKLKRTTAFLVLSLILYGLTVVIDMFGWHNVIYFLIGVYISQSKRNLVETIPQSFLTIIPLCILFASCNNYVSGSLAGVSITILVISFLLSIYEYCPVKARKFLSYLGCNTLVVVVFSPIFTIVTKIVAPYFKFDPTAITFVVFSLIFVVASSLFCSKVSDLLKISKYIFWKDRIYVGYKEI